MQCPYLSGVSDTIGFIRSTTSTSPRKNLRSSAGLVLIQAEVDLFRPFVASCSICNMVGSPLVEYKSV
ncbi:hypothetical protein HS088_TW07G00264 [Tripterygium wilfordii]|uniref:Uncharacterized protein n=1 Tax=Tripterygium wilfordii TaxID=458696 RepID=A0A7J7DF51_TRIWF|nr:hypothetical protein HS088_TW07G00264 [Tripterygium wilfordii]